MKYSRLYRLLSLGIILVFLALSPVPVHAAGGAITFTPDSGRVGDRVRVDGSGFSPNKVVYLYFSSDNAGTGGYTYIDSQVDTYEIIAAVATDANGYLVSSLFYVPEALTQGFFKKDVHDGTYYVYATYVSSKQIVAKAVFTVIDGEIELNPEEGTVGMEVWISGEYMRKNQQIIVKYDHSEVDIIGGNTETDDQGRFVCAIIVPESVLGSHTITVIDESYNMAEAEFSVKPNITLTPAEQVIGGTVTVDGTGFEELENIDLTIDGHSVENAPVATRDINANSLGSFHCSFTVPLSNDLVFRKVRASGNWSLSWADAQLTVLTSIALRPIISPASPGNVGMELTVYGSGFVANGMVTVTYGTNDAAIPVATATADDNGNFSAKFTVPPSVAGDHIVTATGGATSVTAIFTMESQTPLMPQLLEPEVGGKTPAEVYFDWEDATDPSGVSYTLQVATDTNFTAIVLERGGLATSEYEAGEGELVLTGAGAPYYWRVKAVDGASNEGEWSLPHLFYISSSGISLLSWVWYTLGGLVVLLLIIVGFWWWKRRSG